MSVQPDKSRRVDVTIPERLTVKIVNGTKSTKRITIPKEYALLIKDAQYVSIGVADATRKTLIIEPIPQVPAH